MNQREPPHLAAATRRAKHALALLLFPALAPLGADAITRVPIVPDRGTWPDEPVAAYLPALGAPGLRFAEAKPPPDLTTRPAAAAPPQPALSHAENGVAADNAQAVRSVTAPRREPAPTLEPKASPESPDAKAPSAILPDDARPAVRPEDFLPYFQIPGAARKAGDVTLFVPTSVSAPPPPPVSPSSATYSQTTK